METLPRVTQYPLPGESRVVYCGDCITFSLHLSSPIPGNAWVRTNLGSAPVTRQEIIDRVEKNEIPLGAAWFDLEMEEKRSGDFQITLPIQETGFFQAKCFFMPKDSNVPLWPEGQNTIINAAPAGTCCANIIYNAFVRQFGGTKNTPGSGDTSKQTLVDTLDENGYTVIPPSGKFRDLKAEIPFIFSDLGCRALLLLPIHPTPTTYARMGRFGSPYAALNFTDVDPALAEFDLRATPLDQFMELVDEVHAHNGYLFLDIAINHTGWAAAIHETHPEWLDREQDGKIKMPGAWGVVWEDLTKLDYSHKPLWQYMAEVLLLWCHRGVDGFRCDAGYMIPLKAWEYIVAKVREEYPDTLFLLEGLGGPVETTRQILSRANFTWAYSELFQNYSAREISDYLPGAWEISCSCGSMIHFAETHDNNRLAAVSLVYAKMRTALCALFSISGGFGFANGVEWYARDKINVHESSGLNWDSKDNQVAHIARLNRILKSHPGFSAQAVLTLVPQDEGDCLVLLRQARGKDLIILVNLDCENRTQASWSREDAGERTWHDLISGRQVSVEIRGRRAWVGLDPGGVLALTEAVSDLELLEGDVPEMPDQVLSQKWKARMLSAYTVVKGYGDVSGMDPDEAGKAFARDPVAYLRSLGNARDQSPVVVYDVQKDKMRQVMVPPGFFLLVKSPWGFRAELLDSGARKSSLGYGEGLPDPDHANWMVLFNPISLEGHHRDLALKLRIFTPNATRIEIAHIRYLAPFESLVMPSFFTRREIAGSPFLKFLATTQKGGMLRASSRWGHLDSRYDGLLGANLDPDLPEDRWMVLSRIRIWAIFQGYSRELALDSLESFWFSHDNGGNWRFHLPTSDGHFYVLGLYLSLDRGTNRIQLSMVREKADPSSSQALGDHYPVTLILRPDIEDRNFHETVKAFQGAETAWPKAVTPFDRGFSFSLSRGKDLLVCLPQGRFFNDPQWKYMVHRPQEALRGLDSESDLFSPGYFSVDIAGGQALSLVAGIAEPGVPPQTLIPLDKDLNPSAFSPPAFEPEIPYTRAVYESLDAFIVHRGEDRSVIAGYPWFLDWGRDSLIFCRSLIELGRLSEARAVIRLFGRFENQGTLPNMIRGRDAANIETSDAPLWFFTCCRDLVLKTGDRSVLAESLGNRTIEETLFSMARSLIQGTPTGIKADPETLLLYSPSHFTWMDTNYPAGSPRQGYPVEIQALWYNALMLMADLDPKGDWEKKAAKVQHHVKGLFWREDLGYFSDCLHAEPGQAAAGAEADDALRPNQLFLITLGCISEWEMGRKTMDACQELLVPGGIRSLSNRKLARPLPVVHNGVLVNDPYAPYSGEYSGDEDTRRKPAYHNGTAWTWQFPVFCEAWAEVFGRSSHPTCLAWLGSGVPLMRTGAAGFIPEILDGDFPHQSRGCDAQAWGSSEFARMIHKLSY